MATREACADVDARRTRGFLDLTWVFGLCIPGNLEFKAVEGGRTRPVCLSQGSGCGKGGQSKQEEASGGVSRNKLKFRRLLIVI
jgi:hypothetical protein